MKTLKLLKYGFVIAFSNFIIGFPGFVQVSSANPGDLDPSFGTGGIVKTINGSYETVASALVIQLDGKLVVAGRSSDGSHSVFVLVRYNPGGDLDTTFGAGGIVTTGIGAADAVANALAIQSDGKLVAAGYSYDGLHLAMALVRYNTDGGLDMTFGTGGIVTTPIGSSDAEAYALAVSDGKLVAAGVSSDNFTLVRYSSDGSLDTTFGTGGIVTTAIGPNSSAFALSIQQDGKPVAAGFSYDSGLGRDVFALARYNSDGSLDATFGTGGLVTTAIGLEKDEAFALAIQPDGKLVAGGSSLNVDNSVSMSIARYNPDGSLDTTFNSAGMTSVNFGELPSPSKSAVNALAILPHGKLLAAGYANSKIVLIRFISDGELDYATFGSGGLVLTSIGMYTASANAMIVQPDEKLVVAGITSTGNQFEIALARYLSDPGIFDVDMGKSAPPCGGAYIEAGINDIGFVDCDSNTGGNGATAITTINVGNSVRWTMRANPHAVITETALGAHDFTTCGTGDNLNIVQYANFNGYVFTHQFNTPGSCAYFCIFHLTAMQGQVNVVAATTTTSTTTTTTSTTTTTTMTTMTSTTSTTTTTTTTSTIGTTTTTTTTTSTTNTTTCHDQDKDKGKDKDKEKEKKKDKGKCPPSPKAKDKNRDK
jgi:uncharacterized delta-60 repeat protein